MKTYPNTLIASFEYEHIGNYGPEKRIHEGLNVREYFAAMAMQGLCACSIAGPQKIPKQLAKEAVEYADALIEELNKEAK